jgi:hypothetical protein
VSLRHDQNMQLALLALLCFREDVSFAICAPHHHCLISAVKRIYITASAQTQPSAAIWTASRQSDWTTMDLAHQGRDAEDDKLGQHMLVPASPFLQEALCNPVANSSDHTESSIARIQGPAPSQCRYHGRHK